jgi:hypothetical protein
MVKPLGRTGALTYLHLMLSTMATCLSQEDQEALLTAPDTFGGPVLRGICATVADKWNAQSEQNFPRDHQTADDTMT